MGLGLGNFIPLQNPRQINPYMQEAVYLLAEEDDEEVDNAMEQALAYDINVPLRAAPQLLSMTVAGTRVAPPHLEVNIPGIPPRIYILKSPDHDDYPDDVVHTLVRRPSFYEQRGDSDSEGSIISEQSVGGPSNLQIVEEDMSPFEYHSHSDVEEQDDDRDLETPTITEMTSSLGGVGLMHRSLSGESMRSTTLPVPRVRSRPEDVGKFSVD